MSEPDPTSVTRKLYLDLLKRSLLNLTYVDLDVRIRYLKGCLEGMVRYDESRLHDAFASLPGLTAELEGSYRAGWPPGDDLNRIGYPHSMVGMARLENLESVMETVLSEGVPGDFIECGVWRGGSGVFMRAVLATHQVTDRTVWLADSFQGLPKPSHPQDADYDYSKDEYPMLAVSKKMVQRTFETYGLWDDRVRVLEGWFKDTLPNAPIDRLAVLRIDGDLHESTLDALHSLYDRVCSGGYVIVDDYIVPPCREAVTEFRDERGISTPIEKIDHTGIFWKKP